MTPEEKPHRQRLARILPATLHIAALRLAHAVRLRWWRIVRRRVRGCRVLVLDGADRVLLIRHSYGSGRWMHPGGGLGRAEHPVDGAQREVWEETGCRIEGALVLSRSDDPLSGHETWFVAGWTQDHPRPDGREIVEAAFFAVDALPQAIAPVLAERLPALVTAAAAARRPG